MKNTTATTITTSQQKQILHLARISVTHFCLTSFNGFFTKEDIEDIIGNVSYKICRSWHTFDQQKGDLCFWVRRASINCVLTAAKEKSKRASISVPVFNDFTNEDMDVSADIFGHRGDEFEADREVNYAEFEAEVRKVTERLSKTNQEYLEMIMDGMTPKQIAQKTGASTIAISTRKSKILKELSGPVRDIALTFDVHNKKLAC